MYTIRRLSCDDIHSDMLAEFNHCQRLKTIYVKKNDQWEATAADEVREWSAQKRVWISEYLREQIGRKGAVYAAFFRERLAGFCSVDGGLGGRTAKYANLTMLFVDDEMRRKGLGKRLFLDACEHARKAGADKLFISAIPSVETIAFYFSMGCVDAKEIIPEFVDTEYDRYLECEL